MSTASSTPSITSESSRFWRKFNDEQARYPLSLTRDLIDSNEVKREVVWQRVANAPRAVELGLITSQKGEEDLFKTRQRLTDKVRQEARKERMSKKGH